MFTLSSCISLSASLLQVVCDHAGRILSATCGFPGTWNDKTVVRYDKFVQRLREDARYTTCTFELYDANGNTYQLQGVYLIADGGYHKWRNLQCPWRECSLPSATRWSSGACKRNFARWLCLARSGAGGLVIAARLSFGPGFFASSAGALTTGAAGRSFFEIAAACFLASRRR